MAPGVRHQRMVMSIIAEGIVGAVAGAEVRADSRLVRR